jgi:hypothetical protein
MLPGDFTVSEGHGHPLVILDWNIFLNTTNIFKNSYLKFQNSNNNFWHSKF